MTPAAKLAVAQTPEEAAQVLLEQARQQVASGREIVPLAVVVCQENDRPAYDLMSLTFNAETGSSDLRQVVALAKQKTAKAIITVSEANDGNRHRLRPSGDSIVVTVSGEGFDTLTMRLPYTRRRWPSKIEFGEVERTRQAAPVAFLRDWP